MDPAREIAAWVLAVIIGLPFAAAGAFHFFLPESAWGLYRWWSSLWGSDPEAANPDYPFRATMKKVGVVFGLGAVFLVPATVLLRDSWNRPV